MKNIEDFQICLKSKNWFDIAKLLQGFMYEVDSCEMCLVLKNLSND